ncbi:MAG TPA: Sec-independent protein translocase protein TatB [Burkholderiales bacterium]|nr:Sec-independent protein translocase protein TatB [Burkholderiales bacterium]
MFGISFSEILLIIIISLLIFGPEQLPQIAAKTGRMIALLRKFTINLKSQLYEQTGMSQIDGIRQEMQQTFNQLKNQIRPLENKITNYSDEGDFLYSEYQFLYQPELDFEQQPELFDSYPEQSTTKQ